MSTPYAAQSYAREMLPSAMTAVDALQSGVFDFLTRSFDLTSLADHLLDAVHRAFADDDPPSARVTRKSMMVARDPVHDVLVGDSGAIERARQEFRVGNLYINRKLTL